MSQALLKTFKTIVQSTVDHGIDWIITIIATFVSVRLATKKYYYSTRKSVVRPSMEQGLKLVIGTDIFPANAKSILVENKGFTLFRGKKYKGEYPFSRLRKTVCTVGGNENSTSKARARYWGVLGLAYLLRNIVVYDFNQHKILVYDVDIVERHVEPLSDGYYYQEPVEGSKKKGAGHWLSKMKPGRNIMIAVPLVSNGTIVGGVTFDVDCEIKEENGGSRMKYLIGNDKTEVTEICKKLNDIGSNIVTAYFGER